ncbi:MAG: FkbM family methyltransferase [Lewinellaceae bacterium]|jgi:FkbM family methyltransferase|nr:FkbM family methyltransferase [Lewinellaceae bacterium]
MLNLRHLFERLSRGVVLKKTLPADFGKRPLLVSPEGGGLRFWKQSLNEADPMLLQVVRQFIKKGDTVWDVGGNVGLFAFASAARSASGSVAVFEPDILLAHLLQKSAALNTDLRLSVFPLAVSDKDGIARFNIAQRARATNYLDEGTGSTQTGGIRSTIMVPTIRLDTFLNWFDKPDFIKIDVEGAEHLVFKGMLHILKEIRPTILCEVSRSNWAFISTILAEERYKVYDAALLPDLVPASNPVSNILILPA